MPRKHSGQLVEREFLTLAVWDQLDRVTCEMVALALEKCLPEPWKFKDVAWYECGGQKRWVAFYTWKKPGRFQEATFALIPGGEVELGYDPKRPHKIPQRMIDDWNAELRQYYPDQNISWETTIVAGLSPLRNVALEPYLIETHGQPKVRKKIAAERERIRKQGMRLPTVDEWEFACSAGTRSLWCWGDDPKGGPVPANAFGLTIVQNSYETEPLEEGTVLRGGDYGSSEQYGLQCARVLSSWQRDFPMKDYGDWWIRMRWRRVFPLPPDILG